MKLVRTSLSSLPGPLYPALLKTLFVSIYDDDDHSLFLTHMNSVSEETTNPMVNLRSEWIIIMLLYDNIPPSFSTPFSQTKTYKTSVNLVLDHPT